MAVEDICRKCLSAMRDYAIQLVGACRMAALKAFEWCALAGGMELMSKLVPADTILAPSAALSLPSFFTALTFPFNPLPN